MYCTDGIHSNQCFESGRASNLSMRIRILSRIRNTAYHFLPKLKKLDPDPHRINGTKTYAAQYVQYTYLKAHIVDSLNQTGGKLAPFGGQSMGS